MALLAALALAAAPPDLPPGKRDRATAGATAAAVWVPVTALYAGVLPVSTDYGLWPLLVLGACGIARALRQRTRRRPRGRDGRGLSVVPRLRPHRRALRRPAGAGASPPPDSQLSDIYSWSSCHRPGRPARVPGSGTRRHPGGPRCRSRSPTRPPCCRCCAPVLGGRPGLRDHRTGRAVLSRRGRHPRERTVLVRTVPQRHHVPSAVRGRRTGGLRGRVDGGIRRGAAAGDRPSAGRAVSRRPGPARPSPAAGGMGTAVPRHRHPHPPGVGLLHARRRVSGHAPGCSALPPGRGPHRGPRRAASQYGPGSCGRRRLPVAQAARRRPGGRGGEEDSLSGAARRAVAGALAVVAVAAPPPTPRPWPIIEEPARGTSPRRSCRTGSPAAAPLWPAPSWRTPGMVGAQGGPVRPGVKRAVASRSRTLFADHPA